MKVKSKITGEMVDLSDLGQRFPNDVLAIPMDKVGKVLAQRMKGFAPVGSTGHLRDSIANKTVVYSAKNRVVSIIGPRRKAPGKPTKYAHLVEFGHLAGGVAAKKITHVAAHPFVRPTAEIARAEAAQIIGDEAADNIGVALKRARKKKIVSTQY